ncbi:glycerol dehydrogenase [Trypanosoma grayi]|uniref:glycerol dehydrogenase n=1 Tax=Trypanosoma grayi TaxID=71804 RepID=UPI0004F416DE|nr:glycerol dehydrogenase [Trypanosoma grayi]KEG13052.1 glycerol dehydrogenase [Trypanosoma grayi]
MLRFSVLRRFTATGRILSQQCVGVTTSIFPGRYVQGPGAMNLLGEELARLGKRALVLQPPSVSMGYGPRLQKVLEGKVDAVMEAFRGESSDEEINRLCKIGSVDVVAGIGGGKTVDTAKAVAYQLKVPVAVMPTVASTDAPCSALSVIYKTSGEFDRYLILPHNPNVVLVDSDIVSRAPVRLLVSGMGDALATWFEAESCAVSRRCNLTGRLSSHTALGLARLCYDTLLQYGVLAKEACAKKTNSPALERVIEANTLLSGLGFESGGLAGAHAIHNGLTQLPEAHNMWHGEKVTIGLLASLTLTDKPPQVIDEVYSFCESVGLPTTLADIGCSKMSDEALMKVAETACAPGETIHNEAGIVTPEAVMKALRAADAIGCARKRQ